MAAESSRTAGGASSSSSRPPRRRRSRATSATTSSSSRRSATFATSRSARPRCRQRRRRSRGRASASTSTTTSSRSTSSIRRRRRSSPSLQAKLKDADELLLATDEDREGEAIAWHLVQVLKPTVPVRRMVFHEITQDAIERALERDARDRRRGLVDAQETRRILDRLYGYEVSPVLWRKVMQGLSAGRVQSVATRLVVERERERMAFVAAEYWDIVGDVRPRRRSTARLAAVDGQPRRAGPRLRPRRDAAARRRRRSSTRTTARGARRRARRARRSRSRSVEREAVHAPARGAVHDLDAAAGGEPQAPLLRAARRCASPSGCTRTATSPTCAPTRRRCRSRRSRRRATQARELYGADDVPGAAAPLRPQGEERAGGARGDPPGRRPLPHARRGARRARARRVRALRADLEAHGRVADGGRARRDGLGAASRRPRPTGATPSSAPPAP